MNTENITAELLHRLQGIEQRQSFLLNLSDMLRALKDDVAIKEASCRITARYFRVSRSYYAEIDNAQQCVTIEKDHINGDAASLSGVYDLSSTDPLVKTIKNEGAFICDDIHATALLDQSDRLYYTALSIGSLACYPLIKEGQLIAAVVVADANPRSWLPSDISLLQEVAERTWDAIERVRSEAALRQSETKYRKLFETIDQGFAICEIVRDPNGNAIDSRYLEANAAMQKHAGICPSDVVGCLHSSAPHGLDKWLLQAAARVVETQRPEHFEDYNTIPNHWQGVTILPLIQDQFALLYDDITEKKKTEDARRESDRRYRRLFQIIEVGFITHEYIRNDAGDVIDVRYGEVNDAYSRLAAIKAEDIIGKLGSEMVREELEYWLPLFSRVASGHTVRLERYLPFCERWYDIALYPDGIDRGICLFDDITHRKLAEKAVSDSEAKFRSYFELGLIGMAIASPDKQVLEVNDEMCKIMGYERDELVNMFWPDFTHPDDLAASVKKFELALRGETDGYSMDKRFIRKDGQVIDATVSVKAMRNADGGVEYFVALLQDITERKKDIATLELLLQQKDEFIQVASHELKTPLTSVKIYAEVLLEKLKKGSDNDNVAMMEKLNCQLNRLTTLVRDLLDTRKISDGNLQLCPEVIDINQLIAERIEELEHTSASHKIILDEEQLKPLVADKERINQVLTNLITNAIRYSPEGGDITIMTQSTDDGVKVSVQDKGIGIPKQVQDNIFERFFRVNNAKSPTFSGMGLGLFISSEIVRRHGGNIEVNSNEGEGSVFSFTLPYDPFV